MQIRYVNTASTVGTQDGTTNTPGSSGTAAFATLRQAIDSLGTLSEPYTIYCSGGEDTGDVNQAPWDFVTTATNYLLITTQGDQRHNGHWDESKYYLHATNQNGLYSNTSAHVRIDGLQVKVTVNNGGDYIGIKTTNANQTASDVDMRVTNCIVKAVLSNNSGLTGFTARPVDVSGGIAKNVFVNCMAIDCYQGFTSDEVSCCFYNCGAYDITYGFVADAACTVKNCISKGATIGFVGTFSGSSTDCAENDGNGITGGTNHSSGVTFSFFNAAADNFSLTATDTGAKEQGTDLSSDSVYPFSTDVTGRTRVGTWDRGPFGSDGILYVGYTYNANGDSATTLIPAVPGPTIQVQKGDLITVFSKWEGLATTVSITDDAAGGSNTYIERITHNHTAGEPHGAFHSAIAKASETLTITQTLGAARPFRTIVVTVHRPSAGYELVYDNSAGADEATSPYSTGSFAVAGGSGVAICAIGEYAASAFTPGSGWTEVLDSNTFLEQRILTTETSIEGNATADGSVIDCVILAVAFKEQKKRFISAERQTTAAANSGSFTVTVPADCKLAVACFDTYRSEANFMTGGSVTLGGMAMADDGGLGDTNSNWFQGSVWWLSNPPTGSQTLAFDWLDLGTPNEPIHMVMAYFNEPAKRVRASGGQQNFSDAPYTSGSIAASAGDLVFAFYWVFATSNPITTGINRITWTGGVESRGITFSDYCLESISDRIASGSHTITGYVDGAVVDDGGIIALAFELGVEANPAYPYYYRTLLVR